MCMIAHRFLSAKGKGANIPNYVIDTAITRHPDGYGVAWRDPKEGLLYEKFGPQEKQEFRAFLKELDGDKNIEYVAHFRFATHGPLDADHSHPYEYSDPDPKVGGVLVFHNGIISGVTTTKLESDTEVFVRDYLAKLPSRWWTNAGIRKLVDHMGGWSRLVLMTAHETVNLNHYAGEEDGGLWYSSDHRPAQSYSGKGGGKYSGALLGLDDEWENEGWEYERGKWSRTGGSNSDHRSDDEYRVTGATVRSADVGETTHPRGNSSTWAHQGHVLTPMQEFDFDKDGDYENSILCEECGTAGDVYIIDKKAYVDIPHAWDREDSEPDGAVTAEAVPVALLLPGEDSIQRALAKAAGITTIPLADTGTRTIPAPARVEVGV
jgi:hypothetical protein